MTAPTVDESVVGSSDVAEAQRPHVTIKLPSLRRRHKASATVNAEGQMTRKVTLRNQFSEWIKRKSDKFIGWLSRRSTFTKFFVFFATIGTASFLAFFGSYFVAYAAVVPGLAWAAEVAFGWQVVNAAGALTGFGIFLTGLGEFVGVIGGLAAFISMLGPIDRFYGLEMV